ncbi:MAG: FlgD immunoglobulin-like domain containing protein [Armatimonadota bacterium]
MAASAAEGYDPGDIMDPPPPNSPEGHLAMFMPHSDWGQLSGRYRWDMRPPITEETTWDVVVQTDRANEQVTLSWPSLRELPKEYGIVLRDLDANVSRSMRTTSVYSYNSGANGGERHLQVVVSAQRPGAPQIAGFQFVPAKGPGGRGDVLFHVNMDCLVDINIRTITGRLVKSLSRGQHFATGQHSVYWDGRNDWGAVVPNGTYLGQIIARTEQGARSSALNRFVVLR